MDCEKLESLILDELYDELDEVTSAAVKRHVSGCARCASLLSGFEATRRLAKLEMIEPPDDLEQRILAAARDAQKVVPIGRKLSRIVSLAGSWSMRPQAATAALFLIMIGTSALLLRGRAHSPSSTMHVSEQGAPAASAMTETVARPTDPATADNAHGAGDGKPVAPSAAPALTPMATAAAASAAPELAKDESAVAENEYDLKGGGAYAKKSSAPPPPAAHAAGRGSYGGGGGSLEPDALNTTPLAGLSGAAGGGSPASGPGQYPGYNAPAPMATPKQRATATAAPQAQAPVAQVAGQAQAPKTASLDDASGEKKQDRDRDNGADQSDFDVAMVAFKAGDYATAARLFDNIAAGGDLMAALWAARSVRAGSTCAQAVPRFEDVAQRGTGTSAGWEAQLEAGRCYRVLGQLDAARQRLGPLLIVPSVAKRAQAELALVAQASSQQQAGSGGGAQASRRAAPAAPAPAPAKPAAPTKPAATDAY
jgi:TolA-binding protein